MSTFIEHTPCPNCGSRDNLAVYDDGHKWCFGCHKYIPAENASLEEVIGRLQNKKHEEYPNNSPVLPRDFTSSLPKPPMLWLRDYGITTQDIIKNKLGWSQLEKMLIFPYYGEGGEVLFWQGRYFPARKPKVFSCGYPHNHLLIHTSPKKSRTIVVVEDAVSAIKVARYADSLPLFGCNLPIKTARRLSRYYDNLIIWLDFDKISEALSIQQRMKSLFQTVYVGSTETDPKETSDEEINKIINQVDYYFLLCYNIIININNNIIINI